MALPESLPARFGRYELTSLLGQGGMGRVYAGVLLGPAGFRKPVAVKVVKPTDGDVGDGTAAFEAEARNTALLRHPNVVDVYDFGVIDGHPFLAMEHVAGWPLDDLLRRFGPLPGTAALDTALQVGDGLTHAHELRVDGVEHALIHRDLKPGNVLVTQAGLAKVVDFGLARTSGGAAETQSGTVRGTPAYMSPEQVSAEPLDPRSDQFALGLLLFELLTGRRPIVREHLIAIVMALVHIDEQLADPSFLAPAEEAAPGVAGVLHRMLRREPAARFPTVRDACAALRELLARQAPGPSLRGFVEGRVLGRGTASSTPVPSLAPYELTAPIPSAPRTNLGSEPAGFVGREAECAAILALLRGGERLVTVQGAAGTGKTRLARQAAADALPAAAQQGGVWFCDLAAARSRSDLLACLGGTLSLPLDRAATDDVLETRLGAAIAARGPTLLLLDNMEQIAGTAPTLGRLLDAAPALVVVVTSRERLRVARERVVELGPLPRADAVRLFRERAAAARAGFDVDEETASAIVERLDRLPLAIELAAARASVLSGRDLLARLDKRFQVLRSRSDTARQATLEAAIEWSWNLLTDAERAGLAQCAVFRSGFSLEAAEQVVDLSAFSDAPWPLDLIEALRDKSLVAAREDSFGLRFALLESIREFALARFERSVPAAHERHAAFYVALGERLGERAARDGAARASLRVELGNIEAAADFAKGRDAELFGRAALALRAPYAAAGPLDDQLARIEEAASRSAGLPAALRARLLHALGELLALRSQFDRAVDAFARAEADALASGSTDDACRSAIGIAMAELDRGRLGDGTAAAGRAAQRAAQAASPSLHGAARHAEGRAASLRGDHEVAASLLEEAAGRLRAVPEPVPLARALSSLAVERAHQSRPVEAEALLREVLGLLRDADAPRVEAAAAGNLGLLGLQRGEADAAERAFERAATVHRRLGDRRGEGVFTMNRGLALALSRRPEPAIDALHAAIGLLRDHGSPAYLGGALRTLGTVLHGAGRLADAEAPLREALLVLAHPSAAHVLPSGQGALAALLADRSELAQADALLDAAERSAAVLGDEASAAFVSLCRAHVELAQADALGPGSEEAAEMRASAHRRYTSWGFRGEVPASIEATTRLARQVLSGRLG